ncbi:hypothetical protein PQX77_017183 [Marasmius sp. AFHP31]|nr:hypothetical protein PQX77_017183 [Marasmius sp. AFHP31]
MPTNSTHRSFADLDCDPRQKAMLALQFTFVPNRNLPPIHTQEYIFVIDKSRSTYRTGKTDPGHAASNLEDDVQYFNFGHDCHGIWIRSGHHTEATLDNTTTHIDGSQSWRYQNRKRTESRCRLPTRKLTTAMFTLEDGDDDNMANKNVTSVQCLSASHNTRLEIHALGIGSGVSTQICQDIALAGNGVCLSPVEAEDISVSCIRLLAAG